MNQIYENDFSDRQEAKYYTLLGGVRAAIARRTRDTIKRDGITHADAASLTGFGRTVITAVCNGKIGKISTDRLLKIGARLGLNIEIKII